MQLIKYWIPAVALGLIFCTRARSAERIDVWLDVDTANGIGDVDDGLMMIQAFHAPQVNVRGVSVQFGNSTLERAVPIAEHIIKRFGPMGMPVHAGAASSQDFGKETDAVRAMASALRDKPMTIAAVGPVTNVGTLVLRHPELHARITQILIVAARRPGQRFVVSDQQQAPFHDANFEKDVPAMAALLVSNIPLVFVPWEVSSTVWLTESDMAILSRTSQAGAWIDQTSRYWIDRWKQNLGTEGFTPFDTLAIGYLTHPHLIKSMPVSVSITMGVDDGTHPVGPKARQLKPYLLVKPAEITEARAIYTYQPKPAFKQVLIEQLAGTGSNRSGPPPHTKGFDHALLDLVLHVFVDSNGLVDYQALRSRAQTLDAYLDQLAVADIENLSRNEQLALLINAYNAFTIKLILEHPGIGSIKDIPDEKRWKHTRWNLGGNVVSLNHIEHKMIRPIFHEPRIHWALVCAARDCPPLRNEAYTATRMETQLDEQAHRVHQNKRYLNFDANKDTLALTLLYKWYGNDFGNGDKQKIVLKNVARYHVKIAEALKQRGNLKTHWLNYNWNLNSQSSGRRE